MSYPDQDPLIPPDPDEDLDADLDADEPSTTTLLGVVAPVTFPPDQAALAVRSAAAWVDGELVRLREERSIINDQIRDLVTEQERLKRLVRVLDAT